MKYTVCAYFDTELEKFYSAFLVPQPLEDVIEGITDATRSGKVENPNFKELFFLGIYNTVDGSFDLQEKPEKVLCLKDFAKKENA